MENSSAVCPGCNKDFQAPWRLKRHLEEVPIPKHRDGQWLMKNHSNCIHELNRVKFGSGTTKSTVVVGIHAEKEHRHAYSGCGSRAVERDGLRGENLQSGLAWAAALTSVRSYIAKTGASAAAVHHFAALVAHSVDVVEGPVGATPNVASTCIGVGDLVQKIEDVKGYVAVYDAALKAGLSPLDALTHVHYAHLMPAPHLLSAAAREIQDKGIAADQTSVRNLWKSLVQRFGTPKLGTSCPRSHLYVGPTKVREHLAKHKAVQTAMQKVVSLIRSGGNLSDVFTAIAAANLPGARSASGYWVISEGRFYSKGCSGMAVPGHLIEDDAALEACLDMGRGIKVGRKSLQVNSVADLKRLARFIEDVCKKTGYSVRCTPVQATAAMCEATRRGCFTKQQGVKHRLGR